MKGHILSIRTDTGLLYVHGTHRKKTQPMQHPVLTFDLMTDSVKTYVANLTEKDDDLMAHFTAFFNGDITHYELKLQYSAKISPPSSSGLDAYNVVACTNYYDRKAHEAKMTNPERYVLKFPFTFRI